MEFEILESVATLVQYFKLLPRISTHKQGGSSINYMTDRVHDLLSHRYGYFDRVRSQIREAIRLLKIHQCL